MCVCVSTEVQCVYVSVCVCVCVSTEVQCVYVSVCVCVCVCVCLLKYSVCM